MDAHQGIEQPVVVHIGNGYGTTESFSASKHRVVDFEELCIPIVRCQAKILHGARFVATNTRRPSDVGVRAGTL